jgi:hypothetical protein
MKEGKQGWHAMHLVAMKSVCILIQRSEVRRQSEIDRLRWKNRIELNHEEKWLEDVNWI